MSLKLSGGPLVIENVSIEYGRTTTVTMAMEDGKLSLKAGPPGEGK